MKAQKVKTYQNIELQLDMVGLVDRNVWNILIGTFNLAIFCCFHVLFYVVNREFGISFISPCLIFIILKSSSQNAYRREYYAATSQCGVRLINRYYNALIYSSYVLQYQLRQVVTLSCITRTLVRVVVAATRVTKIAITQGCHLRRILLILICIYICSEGTCMQICIKIDRQKTYFFSSKKLVQSFFCKLYCTRMYCMQPATSCVK